MGKGAKTPLKVREGLLSGGLINPYRAFAAGGYGRLKEANGFSISRSGFVPMAARCHTIPVTLPPHQAPSLLLNPGGWEAPSISKRHLLVVVAGTHLLYPGGSFSFFRQSHQAKIPQFKLSSTLLKRRSWFPVTRKKCSLSSLSSQHCLSRDEREFPEILQVNPLIVSEAKIN